MAFRELECTQGVRGYETANRTFVQKGGKRLLAWALRSPPARCRRCGSRDVRAYPHRVRTLAGLPAGRCPVRFLVPVRKIICRRCGNAAYERVPFAARKNARITRALARTILALAREMSMSAIAAHFGVSWRTVRDTIEDGLRKRYRKRDFSRVRNLGIDELHVFAREQPSRRYVTVVRDVDSGEVLEVARGKGVAALRRFARKIAPFRDRIRTVSLDMASSYASWASDTLPDATVVIDRFHVVKAMNDRVDKARRRVVARVSAETAQRLKGHRYLFLRNREDLSRKEESRLAKALEPPECAVLAEVHLYKERLRSLYASAATLAEAAPLFDEWLRGAAASGVPELEGAAKTFTRHRDGILVWWRTSGRNNASTEGFNRRIRGLLATAYGFHDYPFLRLRIFDLGEPNPIKG